LETVTAGANANDDVSATMVGVIPRAVRVIGGYLVASINSGGIDANNTSAWTVTIGSTTLVKTNTANLTLDVPVAFGTPTGVEAAAGTPITLAILNGTNADMNAAICHVSLVLADYYNFPAEGFKIISADGGTAAISDGANGILTMTTDATNNDEMYLATSVELFKFAADREYMAEVDLQFSEAATDDANLCFGFMSTVAADSLVDDGGGPQATGDYVLLWKIDGGTKWYAGVQSNGTATPTVDTLTTATAGKTAYQRLRVQVITESSTKAVAYFYVDGVNVSTIEFAYASATEMALVLGIKAGGSSAEILYVDSIDYGGLR